VYLVKPFLLLYFLHLLTPSSVVLPRSLSALGESQQGQRLQHPLQ
jgi:hypothetical protein